MGFFLDSGGAGTLPWNVYSGMKENRIPVKPFAHAERPEAAREVRRRKPGGMSLVEVMLTSAIAVVVFGILYGVFVTTNHTFVTQSSISNTRLKIQRTLDMATEDLHEGDLDLAWRVYPINEKGWSLVEMALNYHGIALVSFRDPGTGKYVIGTNGKPDPQETIVFLPLKDPVAGVVVRRFRFGAGSVPDNPENWTPEIKVNGDTIELQYKKGGAQAWPQPKRVRRTDGPVLVKKLKKMHFYKPKDVRGSTGFQLAAPAPGSGTSDRFNSDLQFSSLPGTLPPVPLNNDNNLVPSWALNGNTLEVKNNNELTLNTGTYVFDAVKIKNNARLNTSGDVVIWTTSGDFKIENHARLNNTGGSLKIYALNKFKAKNNSSLSGPMQIYVMGDYKFWNTASGSNKLVSVNMSGSGSVFYPDAWIVSITAEADVSTGGTTEINLSTMILPRNEAGN